MGNDKKVVEEVKKEEEVPVVKRGRGRPKGTVGKNGPKKRKAKRVEGNSWMDEDVLLQKHIIYGTGGEIPEGGEGFKKLWNAAVPEKDKSFLLLANEEYDRVSKEFEKITHEYLDVVKRRDHLRKIKTNLDELIRSYGVE